MDLTNSQRVVIARDNIRFYVEKETTLHAGTTYEMDIVDGVAVFREVPTCRCEPFESIPQ